MNDFDNEYKEEQYEDDQLEDENYKEDIIYLLTQINQNLRKQNRKLSFIIFWLLLPFIIGFLALISGINILNWIF